jgi:hypothetical protein
MIRKLGCKPFVVLPLVQHSPAARIVARVSIVKPDRRRLSDRARGVGSDSMTLGIRPKLLSR